MKILSCLLIAAVLATTSGCMSYNAVALGRGKPYLDTHFIYVSRADQEPQPGYYALLPLTVPLDAATLPFQGVMFGVMYVSLSALGSGHM